MLNTQTLIFQTAGLGLATCRDFECAVFVVRHPVGCLLSSLSDFIDFELFGKTIFSEQTVWTFFGQSTQEVSFLFVIDEGETH